MIQKLLQLYEQSKLNKGRPECVFSETEIFNEGWLLRGVLNSLRDIKDNSSFDFLPFPVDSKLYSEGQLYTPFQKRYRSDKISVETNTPIDGIVGHFELDDTKSGIKINENFQYLSIFEAKMYSKLYERSKYATDYSQVTRIASCMIYQILKIKEIENKNIFLIIIYPEDNNNINPSRYTNQFIKNQITNRIDNYKKGFTTKEPQNNWREFELNWANIIDLINIEFITWERILEEIKTNTSICKFYELCKKFNKNYVA